MARPRQYKGNRNLLLQWRIYILQPQIDPCQIVITKHTFSLLSLLKNPFPLWNVVWVPPFLAQGTHTNKPFLLKLCSDLRAHSPLRESWPRCTENPPESSIQTAIVMLRLGQLSSPQLWSGTMSGCQQLCRQLETGKWGRGSWGKAGGGFYLLHAWQTPLPSGSIWQS